MRKTPTFLSILLICTTLSVFGQKSVNIPINVQSIQIKTDRVQRASGQGSFTLIGSEQNGEKFTRYSFDGSFTIAPALNCDLCKKGTVFPEYTTGNWYWRTAGNSTEPTEYARILGEITIPQISIPVGHPRFRPLKIYVPLNLQNDIKVEDQSNVNKIRNFIDRNAEFSGSMLLEYSQDRSDPTKFLWIRAEINLQQVNGFNLQKYLFTKPIYLQ